MEKIEAFSKKGKLTRQLHKLLFRKKSSDVNTNVQAIKQPDFDYDFEKFQGKVIRNIHIQTFDPFGFSIQDSTRVPKKKAEIIGRSEEHTSELQSRPHLVCRLLLEKKKKKTKQR